MTPELAAYYRAMMLGGFDEPFMQYFDEVLETQDPLPDVILSLTTCISDREQVLSILREYILDHSVDENIVYSLILDDIRNRYEAGSLTRKDVANILHRIVVLLKKQLDEKWCSFSDLWYDLEDWEDGIISEAVFNEKFDAWLLHGQHLNVLDQQVQENSRNSQPCVKNKSVSFKQKLLKLLQILLPAVVVFLTARPNCVVLHFMTDPAIGGRHDVYVSGFDLLAVGYAVWGPMAAGITAILLTILGIIGAFWERKALRKWMFGFSVFGAIMSLSTVVLDSFTVIGGAIAILLTAEAVLCRYSKRKL